MPNPMPTAGRPAPHLAGPTDTDPFDLAAHLGHPVVVYFYPRDMTPGCTTEARDFRDRMEAFQAAGAHIVGVSRDSPLRHSRFRAKECLPFPLLSDRDGANCERWGVWREKTSFGRTAMGIVRSTFLVDADGRIARAWPKVRVRDHAADVLVAVQAL